MQSSDALSDVIASYSLWSDFLRRDAITHIVHVTDDSSSMSAADFQATFHPMLGHSWFSHAIVSPPGSTNCGPFGCGGGLPLPGCSGPNGTADGNGDDYWDIALATGGASVAAGIEERLSSFTDLVATAIANAQAHDERDVFAREQQALRRVATIAATGATTQEVFRAVVDEVKELLDLPVVALTKYEPDRTVLMMAAAGPHPFQEGTRWPLDGLPVAAKVLETGAPAYLGIPFFAPDYIAAGDGARYNSKGWSAVTSYEHMLTPRVKLSLSASYFNVWMHSDGEPVVPEDGPDPLVPDLNFEVDVHGTVLQAGLEFMPRAGMVIGVEAGYTTTSAKGRYVDFPGERATVGFPHIGAYLRQTF